jgi:Cellulose or protein binding domain
LARGLQNESAGESSRGTKELADWAACTTRPRSSISTLPQARCAAHDWTIYYFAQPKVTMKFNKRASMKMNWRTQACVLSLGSAAFLAACSGPFEDSMSQEDGSDNEDGIVLGTSWEALSYPTCASAASDPDGDGWGWENNRSCTVAAGGSAGSGNTGGSGTSSGASCPNQEGTAATMAALAVSAAMEMKRWQPTKDFAIGKQGNDEVLVLTSTGKARCADGKCANTQALLDFQKSEASGKIQFPGNVNLDSVALRSRLVAKFRDQLSCEMQPSNGGTTNCPVEDHVLTFQRSQKGGCDTNYFFVAKKPDGKPLQYPAQLKNKLQWTDKTNPYIGFQNVGEVVSIDPTYGLNEAGSATTGACMAACAKIGLEDVTGDCCACNGATRSFSKSAWSSVTYLCR